MVSLSNGNIKFDNINAVLFDKDGTFLNDHIYWGKLAELRIKAMIKKFNLDENLLEELCFAIGYDPNNLKLIKNGPVGVMSRNEVVEFMVNELKKYDITTNFETISQIFDKVHTEFSNNIEKYVELLPYAKDFIKKLKDYGVRLAVVTSDSYEHTCKILKILELDKYFDCVIGRDNCNNDKKSGEPALVAIEKLAVNKNETIAIGDAMMDYLMAKNSDLKGVILVATGQTDIDDLKKCNNFIVKNLSEVSINNA